MLKNFSGLEVKSAEKGQVTAVFSTFNVVDKDGDVTLPGAIPDGHEVVISAYGHTSHGGVLPVGKGVIRTSDDEAVLHGEFFMNTVAGRETFEVVKQLGVLGEWSYSLHNVKSHPGELDGQQVNFLEAISVKEVSPVLIGAGVNTRTLATKGLKYFDEAEAVLAALTALVDRTADVVAKRADKGKGLGDESSDLLARVKSEADRLAVLLATDEPESSDADAEEAEAATPEDIRSIHADYSRRVLFSSLPA